ncbi:MAG TPA: ABC transporter ATP-binding protein, partial [Bacteroidia bacterium]|nr:ABC transporter ATP-binding protein [Bacteroidia bacterium]
GKASPDAGTISLRNTVTLGYLDQDPYLNPLATVMDSIFDSSNAVLKALGEYEACIDMGDHADHTKMQALMDTIDSMGA